MSFFWKRHQPERRNKKNEHHYDAEQAIATTNARVRVLEALIADLVAELPPNKRDRILKHLRAVVRELSVLPPPVNVPPGKEQEFCAALHSAVQILVENSEPKVRK